MEPIKTTKNLEFDVIYADGTRQHVAEGILIGANGRHLTLYSGTPRPEVVFSAGEAIAESIDYIKAPVKLKLRFLFRIAKVLFKGGRKNRV